MLEHDRTEDYVRAGAKRLADARELLQHPTLDSLAQDAGHRHLRGAVYLAGYAVECALKAYIIASAPPKETFTEAVAALSDPQGRPLDFRGARSHNLGLLLRATDLDARMGPDFLLRTRWAICLRWKPWWRYNPKDFTTRSAAQVVVDAAGEVCEWINDQRRQLA
ncbi:MAG: hypothetical protein FJX75_17875 [Armatimonadetes bacterium]|nr:hypothetical protein [Armatimonadota bacterium]